MGPRFVCDFYFITSEVIGTHRDLGGELHLNKERRLRALDRTIQGIQGALEAVEEQKKKGDRVVVAFPEHIERYVKELEAKLQSCRAEKQKLESPETSGAEARQV